MVLRVDSADVPDMNKITCCVRALPHNIHTNTPAVNVCTDVMLSIDTRVATTCTEISIVCVEVKGILFSIAFFTLFL